MTALVLAAALSVAAMLGGCSREPVNPRMQVVDAWDQVVTYLAPVADSLFYGEPDTVWARGEGQEWRQITRERFTLQRRPNFRTGTVERDTAWSPPLVVVERVR